MSLPRRFVSRLRRIPRRLTYAASGVLLALGAPLGLAVLWVATAPEPSTRALGSEIAGDLGTFLYVTASTMVVFFTFGHVLGRQADALVDLARTDPLTGLRNQRAFEERLADEVARSGRYGGPLSVLLADVDGLKGINDRGGHHAGNLALRAVADAMRRDARQTDLAARIGGDEFVILAPNTVTSEAVALGDRIRSLVAEQGGAGVTLSIGVATLPAAQSDVEALLRSADAALYEAKHRGRNQVVAFAAA
ncbi:MAG TPA: GGDEF domain-containing protein [Vicinamibacteria bacterium]|nr:GGDEF domain-containing protein [Vicinamibacteria bacterium]